MTFDLKIVYAAGGILCSALAQVCMKQATHQDLFRMPWLGFIGLSGFSYLSSFVLYYMALKYFPISRVSPIMTIGVLVLVVSFGVFSGEVLSTRQSLGIAGGVLSILLILL